MNKERRKRLSAIVDKLDELQIELSCIAEEEQEAFDNLPESIQAGERGDAMYEAISSLEELDSSFEDLKDSINEVIEA